MATLDAMARRVTLDEVDAALEHDGMERGTALASIFETDKQVRCYNQSAFAIIGTATR